jgi:hypothetical protein
MASSSGTVKYELIHHSDTTSLRWTQIDGIISFIAMDEANSDYQRYLEWLTAGGVPEVIEG